MISAKSPTGLNKQHRPRSFSQPTSSFNVTWGNPAFYDSAPPWNQRLFFAGASNLIGRSRASSPPSRRKHRRLDRAVCELMPAMWFATLV